MAFTFSKFLNNVAVPVAFSYAWVTGAVYLNQRKLQYFPDEDRPRVPTGGQFEHLREIELMSGADSKVVRSWWWPADSAGAKTVVYFHGNAGHRGHRLPVMQFLRQHLGVSVLMVGYRGYGGNEGSPSENGFYDDGDAALRWLKQEAGVDRAVLYGESIGTGVAVELATTASSHPERSEPAAVVLQSGFTSCTDVAADAYPFLPVRLLLTDTFESEGKIGRLGEGGGAAGAGAGAGVPVLVAHGDQDEVSRRRRSVSGRRRRRPPAPHLEGNLFRVSRPRLRDSCPPYCPPYCPPCACSRCGTIHCGCWTTHDHHVQPQRCATALALVAPPPIPLALRARPPARPPARLRLRAGVATVRRRILVQVVSFSRGQGLFAAAREPKRWLRVRGAGHNDVLEASDK
jgi:fermentation-respiration switch protein FrsA (DUF1100 family)